MKTQLELLVRLQSCDSAILKAQRIQENHPREIQRLEEALDKERQTSSTRKADSKKLRKKG